MTPPLTISHDSSDSDSTSDSSESSQSTDHVDNLKDRSEIMEEDDFTLKETVPVVKENKKPAPVKESQLPTMPSSVKTGSSVSKNASGKAPRSPSLREITQLKKRLQRLERLAKKTPAKKPKRKPKKSSKKKAGSKKK